MSDDQTNGVTAPDGYIPLDRFKAVNDRMKAAETKALQLEQFQATAQAHAQEIERLKADLAKENSLRTRQTTLIDQGITGAEERKLAQYVYEQQDATERPAFNEWLTSQRAEPAGLMRHVWSTPQAAASTPAPTPTPEAQAVATPEAPTTPQAPTLPQVNPNAGAVAPRAPQGGITADYIKNLTPEQYAAQRDQIFSSFKR